ncbi:MAG: hypothetical protein K2M06_02985 [Muribaculaceae bacterium]|nr:hypothetical protein [Muribaculaceae bacterium]
MNDDRQVHYSLNLSDGRIFTPGRGKTVVIGQKSDADVRLSNPGPYEDVNVARIEPCGPGEWRLLRLGRDYPVAVNGKDVGHVCYLSDKDAVEVAGLEPHFRFRLHEGPEPGETKVHTGLSRRGVGVLAAAMAMMVAGIVWWVVKMSDRDELAEPMVASAMSSLYRIEVDSLLYFEGDSLVDAYEYASPRSGTAFLTTDSLLVTARHCVEPWLNALTAAEIPDILSNTDASVQLALRAETAAQLAGDEDPLPKLVSSMILTDASGTSMRLRSTDFMFDRSRDEIIECGSWEEDFYWRNIQARYDRGEVMLGDAVACRMDTAGCIRLADRTLMESELKPRRTLSFLGFPLTQGRDETAELESDFLRQPLARPEGEDEGFMMLAHGGRLSPGYSGGPVLMRTDAAPEGFVAVGVISVLDRTNGHRSYSVPTTAIPKNNEDHP